MRNHWAIALLAFAFFATAAWPQAQRPTGSLIETIAGAELSGVPGAEFSIASISGLAIDARGNTYFGIQAKNRVYRLGADGLVTVYAGTGVDAKSLEGVPAVDSPLLNPYALAADAAGELYIACSQGVVRVDASTGLVSTVFATPYASHGSSIRIASVEHLAAGTDGELYLIDGGDWRVKRYSLASGAVTVLAGNGTLGAAQVGGPPIASALKYPRALAVAADGTVYFSTAEPAVYRIRQSDGILEAIDFRLPDWQTPLGDYDIPSGLALDERGHLYVAQANRSQIVRVTLKSGEVSIYAGTGAQKFNGDDIPATRAALMPLLMTGDPAGNLTVADHCCRIRRVNNATGLLSTIAGNGLPIADEASTGALYARLWDPTNAVPAPDGSVYITSSASYRVLRLTPAGNLVTVAGGGDFTTQGSEPGLAAQVSLYFPQGLWADGNGDVYFSDFGNRIVRRLDARTGMVENFATTPKNSNASGSSPAGALIADEHHLYMSDPNDSRVWRISRLDGSTEPYPRFGTNIQEADSHDASEGLKEPCGLALDAEGNLYIADAYFSNKDGRILRVDASTGRITKVLSNLRRPSGLAFRSASELCFSEEGGNQVRCLDLRDLSVRAIAGTGVAGFSGDGGPAECAQLNRPSGISFDRIGLLYIADMGNQRIRRVRPAAGGGAPCSEAPQK